MVIGECVLLLVIAYCRSHRCLPSGDSLPLFGMWSAVMSQKFDWLAREPSYGVYGTSRVRLSCKSAVEESERAVILQSSPAVILVRGN